MRVLVLGMAAALSAFPAMASDQGDALAVVKQFIDGFNTGDAKAALATCASPSSVIDEFPPYHWEGPTACQDWANDNDAYNQKNGITDGKVTVGKPRHIEAIGDYAYIVLPGKFSYNLKGKPMVESGAVWTMTLRKLPAGWRITGSAWAEH